MLLHVPEVLNAAELAALRGGLEAADWVDGRETVGAQGALVKQNRQLAAGCPQARDFGALVLNAVARHPLFVSAALPLRFVPPLFNQYTGGENYGLHVDGALRALPGSSAQLRTDISCTLFLCDPDEYEGGELVVVDTYGEHAVKLPAGDLVIYPATSLHRVDPVVRGVRTCSFFWLQSMVRDAARRSMLFELDQTIQKIRGRHGESPETVALTGHYHNLLRMWSET